MGDFEEAAHEYAAQLMPTSAPLMAERLEIAAQEYFAGLGASETEKRQTEQIKWMTKPPPLWKLSGWRPGMPGALTTRAAKAVPLARRGPGRYSRNWAAERFIESMKEVAVLLEIKVSPPYWNEHKGGYQSSDFSRLCDGWLCVIAPKFKISPQTYRDILEAL